MDKVLKLEKRIEELERQNLFLYKMLGKQSEINRLATDNMETMKNQVIKVTNATSNNTALLLELVNALLSIGED